VKELVNFLKQGLSDNATDKASFSRISCAFILYALVVWESYLVSKTATLPDIPANWLVVVLAIWAVGSAKETTVAVNEAKVAGNVEIAKTEAP